MHTHFTDAIASYQPVNTQEAEDQRTLLWYCNQFPDTVLTRANRIAHITSSGFIMNPSLDKVLMIHHNIRDTWAWTGGHADGDADLPGVAVREAVEETGAASIRLLSRDIASLDILYVVDHTRRGAYVGTHLHLSVAYVLLCDESDSLRIKPDENTGVRWFAMEEIAAPAFSKHDVYLYGKLMRFAARCMQ